MTKDTGTITLSEDELQAINAERGSNYGHPIDHFGCTQALYSAWLEKRSKSSHPLPDNKEAGIRHAVYMICDKLARMAENPEHIDNIVDIKGYANTAKMVLDYENEDTMIFDFAVPSIIITSGAMEDLFRAGLSTKAAIMATDDIQLLRIPSIGKRELRALREACHE